MFELHTLAAGKHVILEASGDLRIGEAPTLLRTKTEDLLHQGMRSLAIDVSSVDRFDAAGVGALLETRGRLQRSGGSFVLLRVTDRLRRVLDLCALPAALELDGDEQPPEGDSPEPGDKHMDGPMAIRKRWIPQVRTSLEVA